MDGPALPDAAESDAPPATPDASPPDAPLPAALGLSPTAQSFGMVTVGGTSDELTFTVDNGVGLASGVIAASVDDTTSYSVTGGKRALGGDVEVAGGVDARVPRADIPRLADVPPFAVDTAQARRFTPTALRRTVSPLA